jgi:hypothetical protein
MDVVAVNRVMSEAIARAREGGGPTIVEAITYRFRGHSMADAESYREKAEVRKWQKRDPIRVLDEALVKGGLVARKELHEIQRRVEMQVQDAVVFADTSPFPSLDTLFQNIYAMPLPDRGGAVSGPQVVIDPLLQAKAARLTQTSEERSRAQPALTTIEEDSGGPGGRPTPAGRSAPIVRKGTQDDRDESGKPEAAGEGAEGADAAASPDGAARSRSSAAKATPATTRSRKLPQPGRPGGRS